MKTSPTYRLNQHIALRWRAIGEAAPGIYTLLQADGTAHGASWHPRFSGCCILPPVITVWAEVSGKPKNGRYTLALPNDLGGGYVTLSAQELAACENKLDV
ncbi:MAG: hypothetical protein IJA81_09065 [Akkermansia sp.]|nr:hypothetical protein [Akkermansia sp.]